MMDDKLVADEVIEKNSRKELDILDEIVGAMPALLRQC
jgi:hypothetical protein